MSKVRLQEPITLPKRDERAIRKAFADIQKANDDKLLVAEEAEMAARDKGNPLHDCLEWDDKKAGYQYRLQQVRALIRHICVVMPDDESESKVPKYVSLRSDRKKPRGGYRETSNVLNNKELLKELEATAVKDYEAVSRRYEMLKDLVGRVRTAIGGR